MDKCKQLAKIIETNARSFQLHPAHIFISAIQTYAAQLAEEYHAQERVSNSADPYTRDLFTD